MAVEVRLNAWTSTRIRSVHTCSSHGNSAVISQPSQSIFNTAKRVYVWVCQLVRPKLTGTKVVKFGSAALRPARRPTRDPSQVSSEQCGKSACICVSNLASPLLPMDTIWHGAVNTFEDHPQSTLLCSPPRPTRLLSPHAGSVMNRPWACVLVCRGRAACHAATFTSPPKATSSSTMLLTLARSGEAWHANDKISAKSAEIPGIVASCRIAKTSWNNRPHLYP
eukprot:scaffold137478_cov247-Phaeocystis_antarctica.AAC.1